jgi:hypothetical protein
MIKYIYLMTSISMMVHVGACPPQKIFHFLGFHRPFPAHANAVLIVPSDQ